MSNLRVAKLIGNLFSPAGRRGRLAVFCYHQVLDAKDAFRAGEPTATEFTQDVAVINELFTPLSFGEATQRLEAGTLPARAACITFDDGYANNHSLAAPILESAGVPATFFVAGGAIDKGVMWNDLVIEAIAAADGTPIVDSKYQFLELPQQAAGAAATVAAILAQLKYRPMSERWEISSKLYRDNVQSELPRLMMSREMVCDLSARGFEIGGHTINHPILKELTDEDARVEIEECSDWIRAVTGETPAVFAYPNGRSGVDFDVRHQRLVIAAGFRAAATTDWALARNGTDVCGIPRVGPWWRQGRGLEAGLLRSYVRSYIQ